MRRATRSSRANPTPRARVTRNVLKALPRARIDIPTSGRKKIDRADRRDANRVELILGDVDATASGPAALLGELAELIKEELDGIRALLSKAEPVLRRFDDALARYADGEMGMKFPQVRRFIAESLLELAPDGYRLDGSLPGDPEDVVQQLVHGSSERLDAILAAHT